MFLPAVARRVMVDFQLRPAGVEDPRVLDVMGEVPREWFVEPPYRSLSYADRPLPIECNQTISQPAIVGLMLQLAEVGPTSRVLEVGTGSGYQTALLSRLAGEVYSVEIHAPLLELARGRLDKLHCDNVSLRLGDGHQGWPEHAPFDAIVVSAAPTEVPPALLEQLRDGGRLVIPYGTSRAQDLWCITRTPHGFDREHVTAVRFVPLVHDAEQPSV